MPNCSVCGQPFDDDIRFLNHMMEKHDLEILTLTNQIEIVEDTKDPESKK